ncbi:MAG: hypothetical protein ACYC61_25105 [Isosphaeraceae bacterium]
MSSRTRVERLTILSFWAVVIGGWQAAAADEPAKRQATVLRGRVTNEAGEPLADARVRVAIPGNRHASCRHDDRAQPARDPNRCAGRVPAGAGGGCCLDPTLG